MDLHRDTNREAVESHIVTDKELRYYFDSLSQMYQACPRPSMFGASSSFEILSFACYAFSAGNGLALPDLFPLLDWIAKIVDLRFLHGLFSLNTPTLLQFWSNILFDARYLNVEAFKCLIEVGLRVQDRQLTLLMLQSCWPSYTSSDYDDSLKAYLGRIIKIESIINENRLSSYNLWLAASDNHDIDMMRRLTKVGHRVSDIPVSGQQRILRSLLISSPFKAHRADQAEKRNLNALTGPRKLGSQPVTCLEYLLDNGVTAAPAFPENEMYWNGPNQPMLARDSLWSLHSFLTTDETLLALLEPLHRGTDYVLTVSGICRAAVDGLNSLKYYMEATPYCEIEFKSAILEVSLSEATDLSHYAVIDCLLEYGIDPNVPSIDKYFPNIGRYYQVLSTWNPISRAIMNNDLAAVKRLVYRNGSLQAHDVFIAVLCQRGESWKPMLDSLISLGLNPQSFADVEFVQPLFSSSSLMNSEQTSRLMEIFRLHEIPFDKKIDGLDFLHIAIRHCCSVQVIKTLLDYGIRFHSTPCEAGGSTMLHDALRSDSDDREDIVQLLLDNGADPTLDYAESLLEAAFSEPLYRFPDEKERTRVDLRLYHLMKARGAVWPPNNGRCGTHLVTLLIRAEADDQVILEALDGGCDLNLQGCHDLVTPLMESIQRHRWNLANNFLRRGANINASTGNYQEPYNKQYNLTALHFACDCSAPVSLLETLFRSGANVDAGLELATETPLFNAIYAGHPIVVSLLIAHGATINAQVRLSNSGFGNGFPLTPLKDEWTPLDCASYLGNLEVVQLLFDLGGRSAIRTFTEIDGAVQLARYHPQLGVLKFFEERIGGLDRIPDIDQLSAEGSKRIW